MWACDPVITSTIVNSYQVAGPMFIQALQGFLAAQCALAGDHLWPPDATQAVLQDPNYDFIVVGSGSAGAVVANRLSEVREWRVLLVEAGGDPTLATEIPLLFYNNMNTTEDWGYRTEPQENACKGYKENRCSWPRGKTLGGCSSINGMFYVRGNKQDYDEWAASGNTGWSYEEILPFFKKSEDYQGVMTEEVKKYHGRGGYLNVENYDNMHDFEKLVMNAVNELGIKTVGDINGDDQMGVTKSMTTTKNGMRHSTARAFLSPIRDRKNLHVIKNALATKILFKPNSNVVSGVFINKNGSETSINAKKEVIISAGSINTPQLLMLSGIGPSKQLQNLNIEVKADLPVGENLEDHLFVPLYFSLPGNKSITNLETVIKQFIHYIMTREGIFADTSPHRITTFFNFTDKHAATPDIQFHYLTFPPGMYKVVDILGKHSLIDEIQNKYRKLNDENFIMVVYAVLLRPNSKGRILITSKDPNVHPAINANYFLDSEDLHTVVRAIKLHTYKLSDTKAFKDIGFKLETLDLEACKDFDVNSDDYLECYCKYMTFSLYHPTGTAKMGSPSDISAVVDPELRVKSVERLRVIDASIMPTIVRGNTNAPTIMIAEKGSDMIKKYWLNTHTEL